MQTHRANGGYGSTYEIMGFHSCFWRDIDVNQVESLSKRFLQSTMELLQIATA